MRPAGGEQARPGWLAPWVLVLASWREQEVSGRRRRPRGGWPRDWLRDHRPPGHVLQTSHEQEAAMTVIRFDPFRDPLERLLSMAATGTRAPLGMPMDVYRAGDGSYHVEADLPGVDPDSVEVTVEHSTLTIRAERTPHYGESEQVIVAERPQGSFTRQLSPGEGRGLGEPPPPPTPTVSCT